MVSADAARELLEGSTPGPWCAGRSSSGSLCIAQMADPGEDVAVALDAIFADAALMAAAPDLARTVVALHAEVEQLRAIIEGRTTPPTDGEALDIFECGGSFRMVCNGESYDCSTLSSVWAVSDLPNTAWWAFDAHGRPCAWPGGGQ